MKYHALLYRNQKNNGDQILVAMIQAPSDATMEEVVETWLFDKFGYNRAQVEPLAISAAWSPSGAGLDSTGRRFKRVITGVRVAEKFGGVEL